MGMYDTFIGNEPSAKYTGFIMAQLKCFDCNLDGYGIGDSVPVKEFGFPETATFCDWGGISQKFKSDNIMGDPEFMGTFVVIENSKLKCVTEDENKILYPVFDKYGILLAEKA